MQSARLPLGSAIRDAIGFNDLLLEMRHTWRGTDFRRYNDLMDGRLTSGYHRTPVTPLSAATAFGGLHTPHLVRAHTSLHFEDVEDDDETERLFEQAKLLEDGDYGYRVIAPSPQR